MKPLENEDDISETILSLREHYELDPYPTLNLRVSWLQSLENLIIKYEKQFVEAINADFGSRARHETELCEIIPTLSAIRHALKNLPFWVKLRRRKTSPFFWFGHSEIFFQPLGLVGIISPWNYPLQLSLIPTINALAAGNRVVVKPSEKTKNFAVLLREKFSQEIDRSAVRVILGDWKAADALVKNKFVDHIFFTGSSGTGKKIMKIAAENLTPVTLELGGKSPVYIAADANLCDSVSKITRSKLLNAGQTCIAPDFLILEKSHKDRFLNLWCSKIEEFYPDILYNKDYTTIISEERIDIMFALLVDAVEKGGIIYIPVKGTSLNVSKDILSGDFSRDQFLKEKKFLPVVICNVNFSMRVMQEEIFGPILPVFVVKSDEEAMSIINCIERPLAFYYFGKRKLHGGKWLEKVVSGGMTVNDCLLHCIQNELPFGGIGNSGTGSYHGVWGFENFSHMKAVFQQSKFSLMKKLDPPFTYISDKLIDFIKKYI